MGRQARSAYCPLNVDTRQSSNVSNAQIAAIRRRLGGRVKPPEATLPVVQKSNAYLIQNNWSRALAQQVTHYRKVSLMNKISLVAAAATTTAVLLSLSARATILSVTHHCNANSGGVLPFTWHYKATITGGNFVVDWVSPGGAEVHIRGTIPPNGGEAVLQLTGTTGNSKFTTDMLPHGSPVSFPIVATFGPPPRFAGTGYRNDKVRQCQLTFQ